MSPSSWLSQRQAKSVHCEMTAHGPAMLVEPGEGAQWLPTVGVVRDEIRGIRMTCQVADLMIERAQRVHDELARETFESGFEEMDGDVAFGFRKQYEEAIEELESIDDLPTAEELPALLGFQDPTILSEVRSTRQNVDEAISRCRTGIERLEQVEARCAEDGGPPMDDQEVQLLVRLCGATVTSCGLVSPRFHEDGGHGGSKQPWMADGAAIPAEDSAPNLPAELAMD